MAPCSGGARKGFRDHSLIPRGHALPSLSNSLSEGRHRWPPLLIVRSCHRDQPFLAEAVLVHDIPGRLRLVAPALRNKPDGIAMLRARLGQLDAVRAIHFNTLSGSVIVEYVTRTGSREAVLGALVEAGCRLRRSRTCTPAGTPEFPAARAALTAIAHRVLNLALESAIVALI